MVWEVLGKERAKPITNYTKLKLYCKPYMKQLTKTCFPSCMMIYVYVLEIVHLLFFLFFSSSKLQHEQHNAWTRGVHHSKDYLPEMFPGSLKGCV